MGKKVNGKQRQDKYYWLAKESGYRSRAAFKLAQLDQKFRFLPSARAVLDLCAFPGGWMQIAVSHAPVGALVVGVDLVPIRPLRGAHSLTEDITTPKCRSSIKRLMDDNGCSAFDVVLHDGSPNIGGNWNTEATMQSALVIEALKLATHFLAPNGTFVTKIFRSQDHSSIIYCLKQLFEKVEVTKPVASRATSAEIYAIGIKYKAPAKIDPRLLDMKHLFQGDVERPKVKNVLEVSKQKRIRTGYEDGNTTLWKKGLVSDFVLSETPLEILGSVNTLSFDDPLCLPMKEHELTTEEIKSLCLDLYVLDRHSFKHLLKWRMRIRKALSSTQKVTSKSADGENDKKGNEDEVLLNEMEELTHTLERKKKREKKILAKRRDKDKLRKATGMQIDATEDSYTDRDLFSLSSMKGKKDLHIITSTEINDDVDDYGDISDSVSDSGGTHAPIGEDSPSEMDSDAEQKRYDDKIEETLDEVYDRYLTRKGGSTIQRKRAKVEASNDAEMLEGNDGEGQIQSGDASDEEKNDREKNPLLVPLEDDEQPTGDQILKKWFDQDVFTEAEVEGVISKSDSEGEEGEGTKIPPKPALNQTQSKEPKPSKSRVSQQDFQVVPAEPMKMSDNDSSSSSDESEDEEDNETKAEVLAYAKKMLRKKQREQILDDAYNRYVFDDEGLPKWFMDEQKRHYQPMKPITKEEVAAMRAQFREIDARPAKKVAEAKARKKRTAMKRLEKVRQKESSITEQADISEHSKRKMIDRLYKKAIPKKPQKEYVVAKKGVQVRPGKGKVLVDPRMKKDARARGMGKPGKGGSKKGKGGAKGKGKGPKNKGSSARGGKRGGKMGRKG